VKRWIFVHIRDEKQIFKDENDAILAFTKPIFKKQLYVRFSIEYEVW
jgi:hypothetical protein